MSDDALNEALAQLKLKIILLLPLAVIGIGLASLVINKVTLITFVVFQMLIPAYNQMREGYQLWQASKIDIAEEVTQFQAAEHSWEEIRASMPDQPRAKDDRAILHPLIPIPFYQLYTPDQLREKFSAHLQTLTQTHPINLKTLGFAFSDSSDSCQYWIPDKEHQDRWRELDTHFHREIIRTSNVEAFRLDLTRRWFEINGSSLDLNTKQSLYITYTHLMSLGPKSDEIREEFQMRLVNELGFSHFAERMMTERLRLMRHGQLNTLPELAIQGHFNDIMSARDDYKRFMDTPLPVPSGAGALNVT
jgi:hypothetical protein